MKALRMKATFRRSPHDKETDYDVSDQVRQWIERNLPDADQDVLIVVEIRDSQMGWGGYCWKLNVLLDEHAGDKEREHHVLWEELRQRLREVAQDPRYSEIMPEWNFG